MSAGSVPLDARPGVRSFASTAQIALGVLTLMACDGGVSPEPVDRKEKTPSFVGSQVCRNCHPSAFQAWHGSPHDLAFDVATPQTVMGDFDDALFKDAGVEARFYRQGNQFRVATLDAEGLPANFNVAYVIGTDPLQQLVLEAPQGRLQAFSVAWDTKDQRWLALAPQDSTLSEIGPGEWLHWTGAAMNANSMCIECHATNVDLGFDASSNRYHTTWSEPDVACEACHGPQENHIAWAEANPGTQPKLVPEILSAAADDRDRVRQRRELETCAPCHARRRRIYAKHDPSEPFHDRYAIERMQGDLYFPDGQIREEVYVVGSFLASRMYAEGVRCSHCHDPHTTELVATGNALCTQCHAAEVYDKPSHTHHARSSIASQCVECHMRERTYMQIDPRRDHGFHLPRPDFSLAFGTPNACNACHNDRDATWARDHIVAWYGSTRPPDIHATAAFASDRNRTPGAQQQLAEVFNDPKAPSILRATALERLADRGAEERRAAIDAGLANEDLLIRASAVAAIESLPPEERAARLEPLVTDEAREIRTEAARILAGTFAARLRSAKKPEDRAWLEALDEFEAIQRAQAGQPGGQLNLAVLQTQRGNPEKAEAHYLQALALDAGFLPARFNLAMLYNSLGRSQDAEEQLRLVLDTHPEQGEAHYSLGLLLAADSERFAEAAAALNRAAAALPDRPRVQYNAGLAAQRQGNTQDAERLLQTALRQVPDQPEFVRAVAIFYAQQERWSEARPHAQKLRVLLPQDALAKGLIERIDRETSGSRGQSDP